jgi:hypothetical protein
MMLKRSKTCITLKLVYSKRVWFLSRLVLGKILTETGGVHEECVKLSKI